jgi:hypothetical protein
MADILNSYQGICMDITSVSLAGIAKTTPVNQTPDDIQLLVLKKAQDMQAQGALQLLQSTPGNLPLATSGSVGTKVNLLA